MSITASTAPRALPARALALALAQLGCYRELCKPGLNGLVVVTTGLGYLLGVCSLGYIGGWSFLGGFEAPIFFAVVIGTTLLAFAAGTLNQVLEVRFDALMDRTRGRPLPTGRISVAHATVFGLLLTASGFWLLASATNMLTAVLGLVSLANYLLIYTPLKRLTSLNTVVGAVTGAIPPMMGWAAATGTLSMGAWVLFGVLFLWQVPHFLAIAWIYRDDYARGGYRMLPVGDRNGDRTAAEILIYSMALFPMTFSATIAGLSGWLYLIGASIFGYAFLALAVRFHRTRTEHAARQLFRASLIYLPLVFALMLLDPTTIAGGFAH